MKNFINLLAIGGPTFGEERRESNPQISVRHPADNDTGYYLWGYDSKEIATRELKKMNKYDKITNISVSDTCIYFPSNFSHINWGQIVSYEYLTDFYETFICYQFIDVFTWIIPNEGNNTKALRVCIPVLESE